MEEYLERIFRLEKENTALKKAINLFCEDCAVIGLCEHKRKEKQCNETECFLYDFCPYK